MFIIKLFNWNYIYMQNMRGYAHYLHHIIIFWSESQHISQWQSILTITHPTGNRVSHPSIPLRSMCLQKYIYIYLSVRCPIKYRKTRQSVNTLPVMTTRWSVCTVDNCIDDGIMCALLEETNRGNAFGDFGYWWFLNTLFIFYLNKIIDWTFKIMVIF